MDWTPASWRRFPIKQQPTYQNPEMLNQVYEQIKGLPQVVQWSDVAALIEQLKEVEKGNLFLLQAGDCAEKFSDSQYSLIENTLQTIFSTGELITTITEKEILPIGRIAGQFAKPRSNQTTIDNGKEFPVFKGDNIHSYFPFDERIPDPERLLQGMQVALQTMDHIQDFFSKHGCKPFYVSHEGLLLGLEESVTCRNSTGAYFNSGTHFLWLGNRTTSLDEAHVEYFRGIANPIGIKISTGTKVSDFIPLLKKLNPNNESGKVVVITRFGADQVEKKLPQYIEAVNQNGLKLSWVCDPMHGNTYTDSNEFKTRDMEDIKSEILSTHKILKSFHTFLGGVHLEMSGDDIYECFSNAYGDIKPEKYNTYCDPRLNREQCLELAEIIGHMLKEK